ncbi:MAG: 6-phosphofructokinase [Lachnospiraceae bacterium]|nr:6-phosphofructokinase [Lachnospiraceae bacterium]
MKNLIVGQSGGPTAVINCSLYGVISEALAHKEEIDTVYGMINGIEGFLKDTILNITKDMSEETMEGLKITPGAYLGSCRYKLPEDLNDSVYPELFKKFEEYNIGYFFYIGGNDSMDTVSKLSRYASSIGSDIKVMGIPKTIDNDLVLTDHTPGFGSAAKYVASTVCEIGIDASVYDAKSVTIVEIMGRHAGWLTAASMLARKYEGDNPVLIYLPEVPFSTDKFIAQIEEALKERNNLIVCVSEGIQDKDGTFICEYASDAGVDSFGHKMLTGCGKYLENLVKEKLGIKVRSVELNVSQRCSTSCQSLTDAKEGEMAGRFGVTKALEGETGFMTAFVRSESETGAYQLSCTLEDVNEICNKEKTVPVNWITKDGSDLSDDFLAYALPLIQGSPKIPYKNGIPAYVYRK